MATLTNDKQVIKMRRVKLLVAKAKSEWRLGSTLSESQNEFLFHMIFILYPYPQRSSV